jgi:hypothetical protein
MTSQQAAIAAGATAGLLTVLLRVPLWGIIVTAAGVAFITNKAIQETGA